MPWELSYYCHSLDEKSLLQIKCLHVVISKNKIAPVCWFCVFQYLHKKPNHDKGNL